MPFIEWAILRARPQITGTMPDYRRRRFCENTARLHIVACPPGQKAVFAPGHSTGALMHLMISGVSALLGQDMRLYVFYATSKISLLIGDVIET